MRSLLHLIQNNKRLIIYSTISTLILYFIFAPAVNLLYYAGDDFRYAFGGLNKACSTDDGFYFMITLGRPLQAYMDCLSYKFAYTLENMRLIRLLAIVVMGCCMGLFADWLASLGLSLGAALATAGSLLVIRELYGDTVSMGALSLPFSILFVLLAYRSLSHATRLNQIKQNKKWIIVAAFWLFIALLTYPAMAFFFPALILIKLLFSSIKNWQENKRIIIQEIIFFLVVCAFYFIWGFYNMHYRPQAPVPVQYHLDHPNFNPFEMLSRLSLLLSSLFAKGGPWKIIPTNNSIVQFIFTGFLFIGGILLALKSFINSSLYQQNKQLALLQLMQMLAIAFVLFGLSSVFYLIIPSREPLPSRLVIGTITALFAILFWAMYQVSDLIPAWRKTIFMILTGSLFVATSAEANLMMTASALNFAEHLNSVKIILNTYFSAGKPLRRVHFVVPEQDYPYDKFFLTNGALVQLVGPAKYQLEWCSIPRGVPGEEKNRQKETLDCIKHLSSNAIGVTFSHPNDPLNKTENMLVIRDIKQQINFSEWFIQ